MGREPVDDGGGRGASGGPLSGRLWLVVSVLLLAAAGVLLWAERPDGAFVAAVLGVSAWFYDVRSGLRRKHDLVRLSGRNWVPREELDDVDDADEADEAGDADDGGDGGESGDDD